MQLSHFFTATKTCPTDDICVFSPSISGLQCCLSICGDYAADHEITFNCNKTIGALFCPKKYKQPAPSNVFLNNQCSAVKITLFGAYCMPMYACQLWSKYTQTSLKRSRTVYNNTYRIMHYIPRNVRVRPLQVSH